MMTIYSVDILIAMSRHKTMAFIGSYESHCLFNILFKLVPGYGVHSLCTAHPCTAHKDMFTSSQCKAFAAFGCTRHMIHLACA